MSTVNRLPNSKALVKAAEMSIKLEKPLCFDYYVASCDKLCKIAREEGGGKVLYRNEDEYTSPLKCMFKVENGTDIDYILETMNSIYVVSGVMFT
jgi:hypothetical protein